MADTKISALTAATVIQSGDKLPMARGAANFSVDDSVLAEFVRDVIGATLLQGANVSLVINDGGDTITISSSGSGGGGASVPRHPGYASGRWYRPGPYTQTNAAVSIAAMQAIPLIVPEDVTVTDLGVQVVTGIGGANGKLAIYDHNAALHIPGNKLTEVSVAPTATNAAASATLATPLALAAGIYWVVCQFDQAVTLVVTGITDGAISHQLGTTNANPTRMDNTLNYAQAFSAGLPSVYPTTGFNPGNGSCPMVCFKAQ